MKINLCFVLIKFFIARTIIFCVLLFSTWWYNNNLFYSLFFFAYNLFVNNNACSFDLYSSDLQTTVLFTCNAFSHKTDWVLTTCCLLCLVFLDAHANSLIKVLEVECSRHLPLGNSIAFSLIFVYWVHTACCCVRLLVYPLLSHTAVVGLHVTSSL